MTNILQVASDETQTLNTFTLDDLAQYKRAKSFPLNDALEFRSFYVGRDNVHGVLKHLLARCSRSIKMNMFGYDDDELNAVIAELLDNQHVFVQGTLDSSQAGGAHEKKILAGWDDAMRNSFAIGRSSTGQITHTKGGVLDGMVGFEGSTNWSDSGEGTIVAPDGSDTGRKAQNNTLVVYTNPVQVAEFGAELDEEHAAVLQQILKRAIKTVG